jgi:hypothetical protein
MESNTLTSEWVFKYHGCDIFFERGSAKHVFKNEGYDPRYGILGFNVRRPLMPYQHYDPSCCQLLLTPIDKISDEVAIEVAKIGGCYYQLPSSQITAGKELLDKYLNRTSTVCALEWKRIFDYLRSQSIDCDNLIEQGIAIDKTTFNR